LVGDAAGVDFAGAAGLLSPDFVDEDDEDEDESDDDDESDEDDDEPEVDPLDAPVFAPARESLR
jgi:hypothetical protein